MKKIVFICFAVFFTGILFASDTLFFKLSLLGVHCASVELIENQKDNGVIEIIYHAFTVGPFHKIYKTNNWYYYYTDANYSHLDSLKKDITDQDLRQKYTEVIQNDHIYYDDNLSVKHKGPFHHVLSSLVYLEHHPDAIKSDYEFPYLITDEGDMYKKYIYVKRNAVKHQDEVYFKLEHVAGEEYLHETDVFNWMICAGEGTRMMAYSLDDHKITEGAFYLAWGLHLRAKRVNRR
jgi:hypothetical protein